MSNTETTMTPAEAVASLQQQLDSAEDRIGQASIDWRRAAADPSATARAAERLQVLERERDMLRASLAAAQQEVAAIEAQGNGERVRALIETARRAAMPLLDAREEMGRQLEAAVCLVAELIQGLHDQAQEIRREWPTDAARVSGVTVMHDAFRALDSVDLYTSANQMLAQRLGRLWPEETAPANRGESIARRIEFEASPIRYAFEEGVKRVAPALQVSA